MNQKKASIRGTGPNGDNLSPEWGYIQQPRASVSAALGLARKGYLP